MSDRDTKLTSSFWRKIFKIMGTTLAMSFGFHPQMDGETERANRSIEEMLRAYVGKRQNDWDERLGMIEFAYNNAVHSSSSLTPFYLCYERHPVSSVNLLVQVESKDEAADSLLRQLDEKCGPSQSKSEEGIRIGRRNTQDHKRREMEFQVSGEALLSAKNLPFVMTIGCSQKLGLLYLWPFQNCGKTHSSL